MRKHREGTTESLGVPNCHWRWEVSQLVYSMYLLSHQFNSGSPRRQQGQSGPSWRQFMVSYCWCLLSQVPTDCEENEAISLDKLSKLLGDYSQATQSSPRTARLQSGWGCSSAGVQVKSLKAAPKGRRRTGYWGFWLSSQQPLSMQLALNNQRNS